MQVQHRDLHSFKGEGRQFRRVVKDIKREKIYKAIKKGTTRKNR